MACQSTIDSASRSQYNAAAQDEFKESNMHKVLFSKVSFRRISASLILLACALTLQGQAVGPSKRSSALRPETITEKTARYFESIRKSPPQQWAFLLRMPKGGDLHNHLSGAIYAESYIQWASDNGLCVNTTNMALTPPPTTGCDPKAGQSPASAALTNSNLYGQMIDAWSMRNWQLSRQSGHDHFFDTFVRFGPATWNRTGKMLAEAVSRAARGHVLYLELMLTPDGTTTGVVSSQIGDKVGWDGNAESTLNKLKSNGIDTAATTGIKNLEDAEVEKNRVLKCGTTQADPGCTVTVRYIAQVSRGAPLGQVFAQMVTGFALANDPNSKVVGLNLVQPEDSLSSMMNFSVQMQMLSFLKPLYPHAHVSLHAGELAPGFVPPDGLSFHIRESVITARADRIGHGVDIMHENDPYDLLKEMARRNVMVEICLSSNDLILGVSGAQHPLATYMQFGVPVALATDDEGVSRSEISREFLKGAEDQGLGYLQLKMMARNSLQYAFVAGDSLWSDSKKFVPVAQCRSDLASMKVSSSGCEAFIKGNEKARLQFRLEERLRDFEKVW
jgi:adenosine deaminase